MHEGSLVKKIWLIDSGKLIYTFKTYPNYMEPVHEVVERDMCYYERLGVHITY